MEDKIIELIKLENDEGVKVLVKNYSGLIYYIVSNIVEDQEYIEECMNDIYMKIWRSINSYSKEKSKFTTWITAISRNSAIDYYKKKQGIYEELKEDFVDKYSTEDEIVKRENSELLKLAINSLSSEEQQIFYHKYYYMQKTSQIAAELGLMERSIEGKLYRMRKKLQKRLGRDIHG
ncbi:MAG: sigma-70 family RNA polymerase sigma factor [Tissierella sp.]|nr:sigma-70 family RNA polymerase sigma factor [Tissierella sp.]